MIAALAWYLVWSLLAGIAALVLLLALVYAVDNRTVIDLVREESRA